MQEPKPYKPVDFNAPRYNSGQIDITVLYYTKGTARLKAERKFYKELKAQYPQLVKYTDRQIQIHITEFNKLIVQTAVDNRDGIMLPGNMGLIMVCTMGERTKATDHQLSRKLGKELHYQNEHSQGYGGGVYYSTTQAKEHQSKFTRMYENCEYWSVVPDRKFKTLISAAYIADWKKYHMLPRSRRYADMVDSYRKQLKAKQVVKEIKDIYDEFDFSTKPKIK